MANNTVKIKRTTTVGKFPTTSDINIGEFSFNLTDRRAFTSDGSNVWEVGANVAVKTVGANSSQNGFRQDFVQSTTTGTSTQTIDFWAFASWRTGTYNVSAKDNNANNYLTATVNLLWDGGVPAAEVYGVNYSNTYMGTFTASSNATHAFLQFTPVSTNTTVSMSRTLITI